MSVELVKVLLLIAKLCAQQTNCEECEMRDFCMKQPLSW